jgi:hypothetical protein
LIVTGAAADGYGSDMHTLRIAATLGVLFVAALVLVWPDRRLTTRVAAVCAALVGGPVAWLWVPSGFSGLSLTNAWFERNRIEATLALVRLNPDEVERLPRLRERVESLTAEYPSLCVDLHRRLDEETEQVVTARVGELRELSANDTAGFARTAPARRALSHAIPDARPRLVAAEEEWAARWAGFTVVGYTHSDISPRHVREGCRECEQQLREMPALDDAPTRLLEARRVFYRAAHESAVKEIRALHEGGRFERAFGVALAHGFEWGKVPGLLGPDDQNDLDALRERCRALLQPDGDPEAIPPPRAIETAPAPRPR